MKKINLKTEWIFWILLAIPFIYDAFTWDSLPEEVPIHYDLQGNPDGYASRFIGVILFPAINLSLYVLLLVIPEIDPLKKNYEKFEGYYRIIRLGSVLLFNFLFFFSIASALKSTWAQPRFIIAGFFVFFIFFGNFMKTVKPNFFLGI